MTVLGLPISARWDQPLGVMGYLRPYLTHQLAHSSCVAAASGKGRGDSSSPPCVCHHSSPPQGLRKRYGHPPARLVETRDWKAVLSGSGRTSALQLAIVGSSAQPVAELKIFLLGHDARERSIGSTGRRGLGSVVRGIKERYPLPRVRTTRHFCLSLKIEKPSTNLHCDV